MRGPPELPAACVPPGGGAVSVAVSPGGSASPGGCGGVAAPVNPGGGALPAVVLSRWVWSVCCPPSDVPVLMPSARMLGVGSARVSTSEAVALGGGELSSTRASLLRRINSPMIVVSLRSSYKCIGVLRVMVVGLLSTSKPVGVPLASHVPASVACRSRSGRIVAHNRARIVGSP